MIQRAAVVHSFFCGMCFSFYCQYVIRAPLSDFRTPLVFPAGSDVPFGLSTTGYEPCLAQAPTTNRIKHRSLLSKSPVRSESRQSGAEVPVRVSAAEVPVRAQTQESQPVGSR